VLEFSPSSLAHRSYEISIIPLLGLPLPFTRTESQKKYINTVPHFLKTKNIDVLTDSDIWYEVEACPVYFKGTSHGISYDLSKSIRYDKFWKHWIEKKPDKFVKKFWQLIINLGKSQRFHEAYILLKYEKDTGIKNIEQLNKISILEEFDYRDLFETDKH
jgi:hypothetical protein